MTTLGRTTVALAPADGRIGAAYQCECADCGADPGELCLHPTIGERLQRGHVHTARLEAGRALHASRAPRRDDGPRLPYACPRCEQLSDTPGPCPRCVALERAPQGETVRLFEPAPAVMPGQSGLF